jgi:carbon starvation protein CstA
VAKLPSGILPVAFGSMLVECMVGVLALIAACSLHPEDYFAINAAAKGFNPFNGAITMIEMALGIVILAPGLCKWRDGWSARPAAARAI